MVTSGGQVQNRLLHLKEFIVGFVFWGLMVLILSIILRKFEDRAYQGDTLGCLIAILVISFGVTQAVIGTIIGLLSFTMPTRQNYAAGIISSSVLCFFLFYIFW